MVPHIMHVRVFYDQLGVPLTSQHGLVFFLQNRGHIPTVSFSPPTRNREPSACIEDDNASENKQNKISICRSPRNPIQCRSVAATATTTAAAAVHVALRADSSLPGAHTMLRPTGQNRAQCRRTQIFLQHKHHCESERAGSGQVQAVRS